MPELSIVCSVVLENRSVTAGASTPLTESVCSGRAGSAFSDGVQAAVIAAPNSRDGVGTPAQPQISACWLLCAAPSVMRLAAESIFAVNPPQKFGSSHDHRPALSDISVCSAASDVASA